MRKLTEAQLNNIFLVCWPLLALTGRGIKKAPYDLQDKFLKEFMLTLSPVLLFALLISDLSLLLVLPILVFLRFRWKPYFDKYKS